MTTTFTMIHDLTEHTRTVTLADLPEAQADGYRVLDVPAYERAVAETKPQPPPPPERQQPRTRYAAPPTPDPAPEQPMQAPDSPRAADRQICGAKTRSGAPCKGLPVAGCGRCRMHGCSSPRGMAHPSTKHGRYSKYLAGGLLTTYQDALNDPDLLALDSEISLLTARLAQIVERIQFGGANPDDVLGGWRSLMAAYRAQDAPALAAAVRRLDGVMAGEQAEATNWADVERLTLRLASLVQAEGRRRVQMGEMVSTRKTAEFAKAVVVSVLAHVPDPVARERIGADISRLMGDAGAI